MHTAPQTREGTTAAAAPRRRRPRLETALAILVGIVLGLGVISAFVFIGSEGAIDAPRISGVDTGKPRPAAPIRP